MARKFTDWFPNAQTPAYKGVYQRKYFALLRWSRWNGESWEMLCQTQAIAEDTARVRSDFQFLPWRGLADPPGTRWPGIGRVMNYLFNLHPAWPYDRVLTEAKALYCKRKIPISNNRGVIGYEPNPHYLGGKKA